MLKGRQKQRIQGRMLLLDDTRDVLIAPNVPPPFEPSDAPQHNQRQHGPPIQPLGNLKPIQRGEQKCPPHQNANHKNGGEMAHEPRTT